MTRDELLKKEIAKIVGKYSKPRDVSHASPFQDWREEIAEGVIALIPDHEKELAELRELKGKALDELRLKCDRECYEINPDRKYCCACIETFIKGEPHD